MTEMPGSFPRLRLGHLPTPLEPLERLGEALGGPRIWVKRDDCTGVALGGNKVRKLEYLLGAARADGARTVITVGAVQSNHARQTAALAARIGMRCVLVLVRMVPRRDETYETGGNVRLDHLFGAEVHIVDDAEAARRRIGEVREEIAARGEEAAFIPMGGSNAIGALGYVDAASEFALQCEQSGLRPARVIVASSSGGTVAGLLLGFGIEGRETKIHAISVHADAQTARAEIETIARETASLLSVEPPSSADLEVDDGQLGAGYGQPTKGSREALELTARSEGLVLDPVYTAKAMAGLIALARSGQLTPDDCIVFWHTGGMPALFAYD